MNVSTLIWILTIYSQRGENPPLIRVNGQNPNNYENIKGRLASAKNVKKKINK
jgi:hypothetical protein